MKAAPVIFAHRQKVDRAGIQIDIDELRFRELRDDYVWSLDGLYTKLYRDSRRCLLSSG